VQNVRNRVVPFNGTPARRIEPHRNVLARLRRIIVFEKMDKGRTAFLRVRDSPLTPPCFEHASVTHLTTHLRVTDRIVQNDRGLRLGRRNRKNVCSRVIVLIAEEIRGNVSAAFR
jgi:hypothetical protein